MRTLLLCLATVLGFSARADVIAQWNFNSVVPDGDVTTGTTHPSVGNGTATALGGATSAFATGATGQTGDPASADNSAWHTAGYPAQGQANLSAGVEFAVDTSGFENIQVSWLQRQSSTASRYTRVQYSIDGSTFENLGVLEIQKDSVFIVQTADLSVIAATGNNPLFRLRIVTEFESTALGSGRDEYVPVGLSNYGTSGTIRYDMVTISGTPSGIGNTAPFISSLPNVTLRLGQRSDVIPLMVSDGQDPADSLVLSGASSDESVVASDQITFGGSSSNRTVALRAGSVPGDATVTISVTDSGGKTSSMSFRATVLPDNTAPVISTVSRTNVLVGQQLTVAVTVDDAESPPDTLVLNAEPEAPAILPSHAVTTGGSGSNRFVTLTAGNSGAVSGVVLSVTDGMLTSSTRLAVAVRSTDESLLEEPFNYPDGSVLTNSAYWMTRSGTVGQAVTTNRQLLVTSSMTEDLVAPLPTGPFAAASEKTLYASFRLVATELIPRTNPGLIAHFADGSTLRGRVYVSTAGSAGGNYRVMVANGSSAGVELPLDLVPGRGYTVVTRYNVSNASTTLWVDPASESDAGVDGNDIQPPARIVAYGFRQDTDIGGSFLVDDLKAGFTFDAVAGSLVTLNYAVEAEDLVLSWSDLSYRLQVAEEAAGPYSDVPQAAGSYRQAMSGGKAFFRLAR